jgi:hypothetical protein
MKLMCVKWNISNLLFVSHRGLQLLPVPYNIKARAKIPDCSLLFLAECNIFYINELSRDFGEE